MPLTQSKTPDPIAAVGQAPNRPRSSEIGAHHRAKRAPTISEMRNYEADVIPVCKELGATFVAYSPLGRGMLTGAFGKAWKPEGPDFRSAMAPRFAGEALEANLALVAEIEALATAKNVKAGQIALAWVLSRGEHIVAIPGTTKLANLESNLAAANVVLSADEAERLESLAARVQGQRYNERGMGAVNA